MQHACLPAFVAFQNLMIPPLANLLAIHDYFSIWNAWVIGIFNRTKPKVSLKYHHEDISHTQLPIMFPVTF